MVCLSSPVGPVQDLGEWGEETRCEVGGQAADLGQAQRDEVLFTRF